MSNRPYIVLVVNPGSTSTKLAIAVEEPSPFSRGNRRGLEDPSPFVRGNGRELKLRDSQTIQHSPSKLAEFPCVWKQFPYRLDLCLDWAKTHLKKCDAVVSMGGLLRPIPGGTYLVNEKMIHDAEANLQGEHASNLGCALAYRLASEYRCLSFVVDSVSVDEFEPLAYYSGYPCIKRRSLSHAVSLHAAARRAADELNIPVAESSFVVCHLGGGISVAAVMGGRIIDVNDAASDGPFSPERTGGLPLQPLIDLCYSHKFTREQMKLMVMGRGGLVAYLGTNTTEEVEQMINQGDAKAKEVYQAMAYQISKEIGAMATVLRGDVAAIVITGGVARSKMLIPWIEERVHTISRVLVYPGDDEMKALALGALRVLRGQEQAKEY
jgi:butyrate kinase